jgi:hypothetical protein
MIADTSTVGEQSKMKIFCRTIVASIGLAIATPATGDVVTGNDLEQGQATIRDVLPIESHYYTGFIQSKDANQGQTDFAFNFGTTPNEGTVAIADFTETADGFAIDDSQRGSFPFTLAIVSASVAAILVTGFAAAIGSAASRSAPTNNQTNSPAPPASAPHESTHQAPMPKGERGRSSKTARRAIQSTKD